MKARGDGLQLPLDGFQVTLAPGAPACLIQVDWDPDEPDRWSLTALDPGPGYAAAVCVERSSLAN